MKWIWACLRKYADFSGRARRKEFWYFYLFVCVCNIAAMLLDLWLFGASWSYPLKAMGLEMSNFGIFLGGPLYWLVTLVVFIPGLAVTARRLHDTGRSLKLFFWIFGAYLFAAVIYCVILSVLGDVWSEAGPILPWMLVFVQVFGIMFRAMALGIFIFVWLCNPGDRGDNTYGPDPMMVADL